MAQHKRGRWVKSNNIQVSGAPRGEKGNRGAELIIFGSVGRSRKRQKSTYQKEELGKINSQVQQGTTIIPKVKIKPSGYPEKSTKITEARGLG